ncbi:HNH endonuclease [bacterium]|nr:HNH endonuclease [bacterium]
MYSLYIRLESTTNNKRYEDWHICTSMSWSNLLSSGWEEVTDDGVDCYGFWLKIEDESVDGSGFYQKINEELADLPVLVQFAGNGSRKTAKLWVLGADVYTAPFDISPEDALVLIKASELGVEKKLARLRKVVEVAEKLESASARQPIPDEVQLFVWKRDGGCCVQCGSKENLEFDHIIPVSKGGASTTRNIQLLCEHCNRTKGGKVGG